MVAITCRSYFKFKTQQYSSIGLVYDLTTHINWGKYADEIIDGEQAVEVLPPLEENRFGSELFLNSAIQAQRRPVPDPLVRRKHPNPWWDYECTVLYREKSAVLKDFRKRGSIDNYDRYSSLERKFKSDKQRLLVPFIGRITTLDLVENALDRRKKNA